MLKLVNLTKIYNSTENVAIGLHNISLELHCNEFVAIVGPSGSGKTTLLNIISGMDSFEEGEMFINDKAASSLTNAEIENYRRANVSFIFQNYQLIDSYTVLENVAIELIFKGLPRKEALKQAKEILTKVGLAHRLKNRATKLSGGEKQRVVIARALASDTKILVCDEPTGNLDAKNSIEIMQILKEVSKDKLVLFVTHDESLIEGYASRLIRIKDGTIEEDKDLVPVDKQPVEIKVIEPNSLKTQAYVAMKNITRTPKKTVFIFFIFLILSAIMISSLAFIPTTIAATSQKTVSYYLYNNEDEHRIVTYFDKTYDKNFENFDNVIYRDYLLDIDYRVGAINSKLNQLFNKTTKIKFFAEEELIIGRLPQYEDEIAIYVDSMTSADFLEEELGKTIRLGFYSKTFYFDVDFKVVGFLPAATQGSFSVLPESVANTDVVLTINGANHLFDYIHENYSSTILNFDTYSQDISAICDGEKLNVDIQFYADLIDEERRPCIQINSNLKNKDVKVYIGTMELDLRQYDVVYSYFTTDCDVKIDLETVHKIVLNTPYRVSVYSSNVDKTLNSLEKNIHFKPIALKYANQVINEYDIFAILENLFYFVFIFVEAIVSLFIASLVSSFILGTKKKELGVLRVIGLSEKDILHVLHLELLTIMLIAISTSLVLAGISIVLPFSFNFKFVFDSPIKIIVSIAILLGMAVIISFKWNKKMFKKSAREVLKAGDSL